MTIIVRLIGGSRDCQYVRINEPLPPCIKMMKECKPDTVDWSIDKPLPSYKVEFETYWITRTIPGHAIGEAG